MRSRSVKSIILMAIDFLFSYLSLLTIREGLFMVIIIHFVS